MKKISLLPLVAALAVAGTAQAQTAPTVSIYGQLDVMVTELTNDRNGLVMGEGARSRVGFRGEDKLNNGMTAFFQLEERFRLDTATTDGLRFNDKSWVGLRGGFGELSAGRVPTALDVIYGAAKAANLETQADWDSRKGQAQTRYNNAFFYTSPAFGPFTVYANYGLREGANDTPAPFGVSTNFKLSDAAYIEAGVARDTNFFDSAILNAGFKVSPNLELIAAYVFNKGYDGRDYGGAATTNFREAEETRVNLGAKFANVAGGDLWITGGLAQVTDRLGVDAEDYLRSVSATVNV